MQLAVPLASAAIIAVIEAISNRNATSGLQMSIMPSMLIMIRNPKAIEDDATAVAIVVDMVVDSVHLAALAMKN